MRLVACGQCHTQYDVSATRTASITCVCGNSIENKDFTAIDSAVHRCSSCGASVEPDAAQCDYCQGHIVRDRKQLGMICPECFARNTQDAKFCSNCAVEFRPQAPPEATETLLCPADGETEMVARSLAGVVVQECPDCSGLWVPGEEFDRLIEKTVEASKVALPSDGLGKPRNTPAPLQVDTKVRYRPCPCCGGIMVRKNFGTRSGVIVDWCGQHGTWLEADELEAIAKFVADGGLGAGGHQTGPNPEVVTASIEFDNWAAKQRTDRSLPRNNESIDPEVPNLFRLITKLFDSRWS